MKKIKSKNPTETRKIAKDFAKELLSLDERKKALVVGLTGELGAGKTTFIKSFMRAAGVKRRVTSPTFLILRRFGVETKNFKNIYHVDAYRIEDPKELVGTKIKEVLEDSKNLVLVEWADKIKKVLPKETIWVKFKYGKDRDEREIIIN